MDIVILYGIYRSYKNYKAASRRQRRWYVRPMNRDRSTAGEFNTVVNSMRNLEDSEIHHEYFRMNEERFNFILDRVRDKITHRNTHKNPVGPNERLSLTLRYLASGATQRSIAHSYKLGKSTVSKIINETVRAIHDSLKDFASFPSKDEWRDIADDYWQYWNFPNTIGAIDGKHIKIKSHNSTGSDFFNYKGYFSHLLLASCDARYCFTVYDVGAFGKEGDAAVFNKSKFGIKLKKGDLNIPGPNNLPGTDVMFPYFFVGDDAFPLQPNLMKPFPGKNKTEAEKVYNYRLSRARRIIENSFGILAARWQIFHKPIDASPENVDAIVLACISLHNFLSKTDPQYEIQARYNPPNFTDRTTETGEIIPGEWRRIVRGDFLEGVKNLSGNRCSRLAKEYRLKLKDYLLTDNGSIPWQLNVVNRGTS